MKKKFTFIATLFVCLLAFSSCNKEYAAYENGEVVEDSYTGSVFVTSGGSDPAGDFEGTGDSGTYSFAWENNQSRASVNFDITTTTGTVQMILNDARGDEVLKETLTAGGDEDTFSGVSEAGSPGMWLVRIEIANFNGDGSYSIHPGD